MTINQCFKSDVRNCFKVSTESDVSHCFKVSTESGVDHCFKVSTLVSVTASKSALRIWHPWHVCKSTLQCDVRQLLSGVADSTWCLVWLCYQSGPKCGVRHHLVTRSQCGNKTNSVCGVRHCLLVLQSVHILTQCSRASPWLGTSPTFTFQVKTSQSSSSTAQLLKHLLKSEPPKRQQDKTSQEQTHSTRLLACE